MEDQHHEAGDAREALTHIDEVTTICGPERDIDLKLCIKQMLVDQRPSHPGRIFFNQLLKCAELSGSFIDGPAKVRLPYIDLVLKADWMTELIDRVDFASDASLDHFAHVA